MRWGLIAPLAGYIILIIGVGIWAVRRRAHTPAGQKSEEYFMGNRSLGWIMLVFTIVASQASAATFIGGPALGLEWGYAWYLAGMFQIPSAFLFLGVLGKKYAIVGRRLRAVSVTEVLKARYESPIVVVLVSLAIVVFAGAYVVAQMVGGARVLEAVTGLDYNWMLVIFGLTVILYTAFGGFRAVALTDVVQGIFMLFGAIVVWVGVLSATGGPTNLAEDVKGAAPDLIVLPGPGDLGVLMLFSFWVLLGVPVLALPHIAVRCMSYKNSQSMHRAMVAGPIIMLIFTLGYNLGPIGATFYPDRDIGDRLIPTLMTDVLPDALAGLAIAAPLAAVMSTVDAFLLVITTSIVRDVFQNYARPQTTDAASSRAATIVTAVLGLVFLALAFQPPEYLQILVLYAIGGLESAILFPLILGLYWRRGNALGAGLSAIGGAGTFIALTALMEGLPIHPIVIALLVSLTLYVVGSAVGKAPSTRTAVVFWGSDREFQRLEP